MLIIREREREFLLVKGDDLWIEKYCGGLLFLVSEDREREKEMEESIKYLYI